MKYIPPPSKLRIVLDTNMVLEEVWYSSKKNTPSAVQQALHRPEYQAFMAESIANEVPRKLQELQRGDVAKQLDLWYNTFLPQIAIIRLKSDAYMSDPRIQKMYDHSDVPTAQLFLFLYPEFLFSKDKVFKNFPQSSNLSQVSAAYRSILATNQQMQAAMVVPMGGIALSAELWGAFRRLPPLVQMLLGGATVGLLFYLAPSRLQQAQDIMKAPETQHVLAKLGEKVTSKLTDLDKASTYLQGYLPDPIPTMRVSDHLIEILSVIEGALTVEEICWFMEARGYQPKGASSQQYVLALLKKQVMFQFENERWHLTPIPASMT